MGTHFSFVTTTEATDMLFVTFAEYSFDEFCRRAEESKLPRANRGVRDDKWKTGHEARG